MKSDTVGLFLFVLLMIPPMIFAGQAAAKDICLTGGGGYILVFKKVESLQPATAIPLTALAFLEGKGGVFPCVGGAAMNADGSAIQAGIFCHDRAGGSFAWAWTATDGNLSPLNRTGYVDSNGDNTTRTPLT